MTDPVQFLLVVGGAVAASYLSQAVLIPQLRRWQLLDTPNQRSSHHVATPRGGGVGVMVGLFVGVGAGVVAGFASMDTVLAVVLMASLIMALVGLADDVSDLPPGLRLTAQLAVGVGAGAVLAGMPADSALEWILLASIGCFWLVGVVNAFNFMDGVNGISGLTGAVAGAWYAVIAMRHDDPPLALCALAVAGACAGFLPWNAPRARVFLGDVGSYGIGAMLGGLALALAFVHGDPVAALAPLSVYLADTSYTLFRRWRAGESLHTAHRDHAYQRLVRRGWPHLQTSLLVAGIALFICLAVAAVHPLAAIPISVALLGGYLALPDLMSRRGMGV